MSVEEELSQRMMHVTMEDIISASGCTEEQAWENAKQSLKKAFESNGCIVEMD